MVFQFGIYSSILLIFFVHAFIYSLLLFRKGYRNETKPEIYLGLILFLCALYICPWMLGFAGWYWDGNMNYKEVLFYIPFQQMLFIGPLLYFYVQSLLNPGFRLTKKNRLHIIPGILYLMYSLMMFVGDKLILKEIYFYADGQDRDFDTWYQVSGIISCSFYLFSSIKYYNNYSKIIKHIASNVYSVQFKWVRNFLISFGIYVFLFICFTAYSALIKQLKYTEFWWYYLFFAINMYYIAINGYTNAITNKVPYQIITVKDKVQLQLSYPAFDNTPIIEDIEEVTVLESIDNDSETNFWKEKIKTALEEQKVYEDPELTLPELSKKLNTNPSVLSKSINRGFGMNFNDLINYYRIEAVKKMLIEGEQKKQTLLGIAYDCGFNSKATFNRAFKKMQQMSPKEWMEKQM